MNMPRDKGKYEVLVERVGHSGDVFLYTPRKRVLILLKKKNSVTSKLIMDKGTINMYDYCKGSFPEGTNRIKAKATKLIENTGYPEIVLVEFYDFEGRKHEFIEKWPVVSAYDFDDTFPKECTIGCVIVKEKEMSYIVDTSKPWDIESKEGWSVFEISKDLLVIREL